MPVPEPRVNPQFAAQAGDVPHVRPREALNVNEKGREACKSCSKPAVESNYGFCEDCRDPLLSPYIEPDPKEQSASKQ
jgi:hypothetical protein